SDEHCISPADLWHGRSAPRCSRTPQGELTCATTTASAAHVASRRPTQGRFGASLAKPSVEQALGVGAAKARTPTDSAAWRISSLHVRLQGVPLTRERTNHFCK